MGNYARLEIELVIRQAINFADEHSRHRDERKENENEKNVSTQEKTT